VSERRRDGCRRTLLDSSEMINQTSWFLADRTNGRAYATVLRPSVVCLLSVNVCIAAKRCVIERKLLLTAYRKSYMRDHLVPK